MARLVQGSKIKGFRGRVSREQGLFLRHKYGRTWTYVVSHPYTGPRSSHQVVNSGKFRDAVAQVKVAMSDVGQYAYWKSVYAEYKRNWRRGMKKYATLRGFMISQLYAKPAVVTERYDTRSMQKDQLIRYYEGIIQCQLNEIGRLRKVVNRYGSFGLLDIKDNDNGLIKEFSNSVCVKV